MSSMHPSIELEQRGLRALNEENNQLAAEIFKELTDLDPTYEHGAGFYNLACALEELGALKEAEEAYLKALDYEDDDTVKLGGYASFLYLHGSPEDSFEAHIKLLKVEKGFRDTKCAEGTAEILFLLGEKMGWSKEKVQKEIDGA
jgi:tetratricopeptide (TPR) repeat protein